MRNTWFPREMAEYQTLAQLKELGDVVIERDSTFGSTQEKERIARERREAEKREARKEALKTLETLEIRAAPMESEAPIEPEIPSVRSY